MVETKIINPGENQARCEEYLSRSLASRVCFVRTEPLTASTRTAPWRLDAEVDGVLRRYVLRLGSKRIEHEYTVLCAMELFPIPTPRAYGWEPTGETFGEPCFLCDFVEGESLLGPVLAGERWAAVCPLHSRESARRIGELAGRSVIALECKLMNLAVTDRPPPADQVILLENSNLL